MNISYSYILISEVYFNADSGGDLSSAITGRYPGVNVELKRTQAGRRFMTPWQEEVAGCRKIEVHIKGECAANTT